MSAIQSAFPNQKNTMKLKKYTKIVLLILAGMQTPAQCGFVKEKDIDELAAANAGLFEINKALKNTEGDVACRLTPAGAALAQAISSETPVVSAVAPKMEFEIETGVPMPAPKRGGAGAAKYPFDKLEIGASFFVPASERTPNPAKSLASTVNSANKRYKSTMPVRKFAIRAAEKNGVQGARIYRIEAPATPVATQ